jgi:uncharacterized protein YbcI
LWGEEEQLDLDIGADVVVGDEGQNSPARETLDGIDEFVLHGVLERVAGLLDDRAALDLDHRLLHVRVDAAEHARDQVIAEHQRFGGDRLAVVVALVEAHHRHGHGVEQRVAGENIVSGRHAAWLSRPPLRFARKAERREPDELPPTIATPAKAWRGGTLDLAVTQPKPKPKPETHGDVLTAISDGLVAIFKEFYGRGPTRAKSYFDDDLVVCVLRGGFTRVEQTLLQGGRGSAVINQRMEFQDLMRDRFEAVVQNATGRQVIGFMSGNQQDPDIMCEVFILSPTDLLDEHELESPQRGPS